MTRAACYLLVVLTCHPEIAVAQDAGRCGTWMWAVDAPARQSLSITVVEQPAPGDDISDAFVLTLEESAYERFAPLWRHVQFQRVCILPGPDTKEPRLRSVDISDPDRIRLTINPAKTWARPRSAPP